MAPDMREPSFDPKAANVLRRDIRVTISEFVVTLLLLLSFPVEQCTPVADAALHWQGHCMACLLYSTAMARRLLLFR